MLSRQKLVRNLSGVVLVAALSLASLCAQSEPFWIAVAGNNGILASPSVDLNSVEVSPQNPQWRTVAFMDEAYIEQHDAQVTGEQITIDCAEMQVVGGMPRLQAEYWATYSGWELKSAEEEQAWLDRRTAQTVCLVELPHKTPQWVDVNKALGETFASDYRGPYTVYDRNSIFIDPEDSNFRTVTARDTYTDTNEYERGKVDYYRHTFDCKNKMIRFFVHYRFDRREGGKFYGENRTFYNGLNFNVRGEGGELIQESSFFHTEMDDAQSPQLIYLFNTVCQ